MFMLMTPQMLNMAVNQEQNTLLTTLTEKIKALETSFVPGDPNYQCYRLTGHEYGEDGFCKVCFNPSLEKKSQSGMVSLDQVLQLIQELQTK